MGRKLRMATKTPRSLWHGRDSSSTDEGARPGTRPVVSGPVATAGSSSRGRMITQVLVARRQRYRLRDLPLPQALDELFNLPLPLLPLYHTAAVTTTTTASSTPPPSSFSPYATLASKVPHIRCALRRGNEPTRLQGSGLVSASTELNRGFKPRSMNLALLG